MEWFKQYKGVVFVISLVAVTLFLETWKLGEYGLHEFDEGRFAANACEMMQNGDYVNLHYMQEPDAWVARPPLKSWLIIAGYKIVGFNEVGARASSVMAIVAFVLYAFFLTKLFFGEVSAFFVCLVLLACKGIVGFHVGRSADMDAELVFFQIAFVYHFVNHVFFGKKQHFLWWGLFLAMCFFLKTTASLLYLPGIFLYLILSKKLASVLKDKYFWYGAGIYLFVVATWFVIVQIWGAKYANTQYAGDNAWQTMIVYDTWMRFTASHFDGHPVERDWMFYLHALDSRFNIWNYLAYVGIAIFLYLGLKKKLSDAPQQNFLWFALCIVIPPALLLTFGMHKLDWYAAPTLYFLAVFVIYFEQAVTRRFPYFRWAFAVTISFALVRHALFLKETNEEGTHILFLQDNKNVLRSQSLVCLKNTSANVYTWLLWQGYPLRIEENISLVKAGELVVGQRAIDEALPPEAVVAAEYQYQSYPTMTYIAKMTK